MKYLFVVMLFLASILNLNAKCGGTQIFVQFPSYNDEISTNTVVLLYATGSLKFQLEEFGSRYPIYLESASEKVKLIQDEFHIGDFNWSQALFRLERKLKPGDSYRLVFEKLSPNVKAAIYGSKGTWKAIKIPKIDRYKLSEKIKSVDSEWNRLGCGPAYYTNFQIDDKLDHPLVVAVEIENVCTGNISRFNAIAKDGKIKVGKGMCSGPFVFEKNNEYKIRFKNNIQATNKNWTSWLACQNPWNFLSL